MPRESLAKKKLRAQLIIRRLKQQYPNARCALQFKTPEQLLFATILSAQSTDKRVNLVTPALFEKYPTPLEMANAPLEDIEQLIRTTGFFHSKAKSLKLASIDLVTLHKGKIPKDVKALIELHGVGRKTANVVLGVAFNIASGIVVDTHVSRLSYRLGLTRFENAVKIEKDLQQLVPECEWVQFSHWLIEHGRTICKARKPLCRTCMLQTICPKATP